MKLRLLNHAIYLLIGLLFLSCSKDEDDPSDPKSNLPMLSPITVCTGWNVAFTTLAVTKKKDKILLAYRQSSGHNNFDGRIMQVVSYDKGKSWSFPLVIYRSQVTNGDARDPQYLFLSSGELLCRFFERTSTEQSEAYVMVSKDKGGLYTEKRPMAYTGSLETYSAARGNMIQIGEVIYSVLYNKNHETWLVKSADKGQSWKFVSKISAQANLQKYNLSNAKTNEVSLCYQNKKIYMVARRGTFELNNLLVAESSDLGKTWTNWHEIPIIGHAPSLLPYGNYVVMSYRNIDLGANDGSFLFQAILLKDGEIASDPITIDRSAIFDIGYGDVISVDDYFLVSYYKEGTAIYLSKFNFSTFKNVKPLEVEINE